MRLPWGAHPQYVKDLWGWFLIIIVNISCIGISFTWLSQWPSGISPMLWWNMRLSYYCITYHSDTKWLKTTVTYYFSWSSVLALGDLSWGHLHDLIQLSAWLEYWNVQDDLTHMTKTSFTSMRPLSAHLPVLQESESSSCQAFNSEACILLRKGWPGSAGGEIDAVSPTSAFLVTVWFRYNSHSI